MGIGFKLQKMLPLLSKGSTHILSVSLSCGSVCGIYENVALQANFTKDLNILSAFRLYIFNKDLLCLGLSSDIYIDM